MPRRFLTAEDVRAAGSAEIRVEPGTLVTPQAWEAAQAAGVSIVGAEGAYEEPLPDRGPDAARALSQLPNLPEPEPSADAATSLVITAVGKNRTGVLAEITSAISTLAGNVHDISQRELEGYFHLILTAEFAPGQPFGEIKQRLECLGGEDDFVVRVLHERVFRFMHRV